MADEENVVRETDTGGCHFASSPVLIHLEFGSKSCSDGNIHQPVDGFAQEEGGSRNRARTEIL